MRGGHSAVGRGVSVDVGWKALTWEGTDAVWEGGRDPWTGELHPSLVISETMKEQYSCYLWCIWGVLVYLALHDVA